MNLLKLVVVFAVSLLDKLMVKNVRTGTTLCDSCSNRIPNNHGSSGLVSTISLIWTQTMHVIMKVCDPLPERKRSIYSVLPQDVWEAVQAKYNSIKVYL